MKKPYWILIGITGAFFILLLGIFLGRNMTHNYVPVENAIHTQATSTTQSEQQNDGRININSATLQQLTLLPGVGEVTAQKIIDYRTENGEFKTIEEIMNINGIGEKKFEQMKPYIKRFIFHCCVALDIFINKVYYSNRN